MATLLQLAHVCAARGFPRLAPIVDPFNEALKLAQAEEPLRAAMFLAQIAHESAEFRYSEEIASGAAYEGRHDLGNTQAGDGKRFKGRGWIQITGRRNYTLAAAFLGLPLVEHPELAADPKHAGHVAAWFWDAHGLNALADVGNLEAVTHRINGGLNGLASRKSYYERAVEVLVPNTIVIVERKAA